MKRIRLITATVCLLSLAALCVTVGSCKSTEPKGGYAKGDSQGSRPSGGTPPSGESFGGSGPGGPPPDGAGGPPPGGQGPSGGAFASGGPGGQPPSGNGAPGMPGGQSLSIPTIYRGAYTLTGGSATLSGKNFMTDKADTSGVAVIKEGVLVLSDSSITTSGSSSSADASNFYGVNAGVLAASKASITLDRCSIKTSGEGANAAFATGSGSVITIRDSSIETSANSSRGLDATMGGAVRAEDVTISTKGAHCAALATDRGEGTIDAVRVVGKTLGDGSPGIYSTGTISAKDSSFSASGSEAAVIEGKNSISLRDTSVSGAKKCGVMLYQSFSGDAGVGTSVFTMDSGTLSAAEGPLFYVTNTHSLVNLKDVKLDGHSGTLIKAGKDRWGREGENGGSVIATMRKQKAEGNVVADELSSVTVNLLEGSSLTGSIDSANTALAANVSLDATSSWNVSGDSHVGRITLPSGDIAESLKGIVGNGYTVYYQMTENPRLDGKTYALSGGGTLKAE